jgi:hypothetical protein
MARSFFYHGSIKKSIIKFLNIFDEIKIAKYNESGSILKYVDVPIKFMPKQKWYLWLNDRKREKRYPMIGVELNSMTYDNTRVSGSHEHILVSNNTYAQTPVPYNLGFTVSIATEYQNEQDQINEQLLPFFNPFVYTNVKISELDIDWDMKVLFEGANINNDVDITENQRNIIWQHEYKANTYLFKPASSIDLVHKVVNKIYTSDEAWNNINNSTDAPSGIGSQAEELLVIGSKEDDEILAKYMVF